MARAPVPAWLSGEQLARFLDSVRTVIDNAVAAVPSHEACIAEYCAAAKE